MVELRGKGYLIKLIILIKYKLNTEDIIIDIPVSKGTSWLMLIRFLPLKAISYFYYY